MCVSLHNVDLALRFTRAKDENGIGFARLCNRHDDSDVGAVNSDIDASTSTHNELVGVDIANSDIIDDVNINADFIAIAAASVD
jgi:hypothetical protein